MLFRFLVCYIDVFLGFGNMIGLFLVEVFNVCWDGVFFIFKVF